MTSRIKFFITIFCIAFYLFIGLKTAQQQVINLQNGRGTTHVGPSIANRHAASIFCGLIWPISGLFVWSDYYLPN
jgi:hypothetical protein